VDGLLQVLQATIGVIAQKFREGTIQTEK
jgi:hypothetical protein